MDDPAKPQNPLTTDTTEEPNLQVNDSPFGNPPSTPPKPEPTASVQENSAENIITPESSAQPPPPEPDRRKAVAAALGVFTLLVGLGAGMVLINRQQQFASQAWDCKNYNFVVEKDGTVKAMNNSSNTEPPQQARVYLNSELAATFDVPRLQPGDSTQIGTVTTPQGGFQWQVIGTKDCSDSGSYQGVAAQCENIRAYDTQWNALSTLELNSLKAGDSVRFTVNGSSSSGTFDKARFTVNGVSIGETSNKKPTTEEFFIEYEIPEDFYSIAVDAQVHHLELDQWF